MGHATLVSGKPPYSACLASKLTHVFVEKALENDVQALQSVGVECLSPDYIPEFILQVRHKYHTYCNILLFWKSSLIEPLSLASGVITV